MSRRMCNCCCVRSHAAAAGGCDCGPWYCRQCRLCFGHCLCPIPDLVDGGELDDEGGTDVIVAMNGTA